ncbi:UDP-N-acetylglucosamine transporter-like [Sycon ciliatum]|uniref:UDP-N-acetylglucosamine transporter-like n=1 Tax=Sycon ciliatum TaxID=27933 RepID=UPI0031F61D79
MVEDDTTTEKPPADGNHVQFTAGISIDGTDDDGDSSSGSSSNSGAKEEHRHAAQLKYVSLLAVTLQTTAFVLTMRYSRTRNTSGPLYLASTAVVMSEVLKVFSSLSLLWLEQYRNDTSSSYGPVAFLSNLRTTLMKEPREMLHLAVPAFLYTCQSNLIFLALTNLDAATFQITNQLKILTTAVFSVVMLQRQLSMRKWVALCLLTAGVSIVQLPSSSVGGVAAAKPRGNAVIGLIASLLACCSSGFAGVYFEKIVKRTAPSLWLRNFQLAMFSVILGLVGVIGKDYNAVLQGGFFQGYSSIVWIAIALQALGGMIVAAVIKYADNILKSFAVSASMILSTILSYLFLCDLSLTAFFVAGLVIVLFATVLYSYPDKVQERQLPTPNAQPANDSQQAPAVKVDTG